MIIGFEDNIVYDKDEGGSGGASTTSQSAGEKREEELAESFKNWGLDNADAETVAHSQRLVEDAQKAGLDTSQYDIG